MRGNFKINQEEIHSTLIQEDQLLRQRHHFTRVVDDHHIWIDRVLDRQGLLVLLKVQQ